MANELLLTVEQAAQRLSLARSTVYELLLTRQLASVKIGRSRRVLATDLADFVDRLRREQGA